MCTKLARRLKWISSTPFMAYKVHPLSQNYQWTTMKCPQINSYVNSEDKTETLKTSEGGRINNWYWKN